MASNFLKKLFGDTSSKEIKKIMPIVEKIESLESEYKALSDAELQAKTPWLKSRLAAGETLDDILPDAFAAMREADRIANDPDAKGFASVDELFADLDA